MVIEDIQVPPNFLLPPIPLISASFEEPPKRTLKVVEFVVPGDIIKSCV
jgi:hypothetical protein